MHLTFSQLPDNKPVWFVYYGLDPVTGKPLHLADMKGTLIPSTPSTKPTAALALAATSSPIVLPMLIAARLYISTEKPLMLSVDVAGNPTPPASADPNDANYQTPWDFFEITFLPQDGTTGLFNVNLSTVQSANLPLAFHVDGDDPSTRKPVEGGYSRGWEPNGYDAFLEALRGNEDFANLVLPGTQRVLAPGTAIKALSQGVIKEPLIPSDYLDAYIARVWKKFTMEKLTFMGDPPARSNKFVTWTGQVIGGQFVFTTTDLPGLEPIVLNVPSTAALFENDFVFCASGQGTPNSNQQNYANQLLGTLCAAFNRSVMLTTDTFGNAADCAWCKASNLFYADPTTNHYSKNVHANAVEGRAYAFQSDDHCDVSSYVSVINPSGFTITFRDL